MSQSEEIRTRIDKSLEDQPGQIPRVHSTQIIVQSRKTLSNSDSMKQREQEIRAKIVAALVDEPGIISRSRWALIIGKSHRTLANRDSAGTGVKNPIRCGNSVLNTKDDCIDWLVAEALR